MSKLLTIKNRRNGTTRQVPEHVWQYMITDGRSRDYSLVGATEKVAKKYQPAKPVKEKIEIKPIVDKRKTKKPEVSPTTIDKDGEAN